MLVSCNYGDVLYVPQIGSSSWAPHSPRPADREQIDKVDSIYSEHPPSVFFPEVLWCRTHIPRTHDPDMYLPTEVAGPNVAIQFAFVAFMPPPGKSGTPPASGRNKMSQNQDLPPSAMSRVTARSRGKIRKSQTISETGFAIIRA
jgi:hypothetical protein